MRLKLLAAAALLAAAPAHAQSDVLCLSLEKIIASTAGPAPFEAIGAHFPETRATAMISDIPPGLGAETCAARMPVSAERFGAAEGEYWEFHCTLYSASNSNNADASSEAEGYRDNMAKRVKACLAPRGWKTAPVTTPGARPPLGELHLMKAGLEALVSLAVSGIDRRERSYAVSFSLRLNDGPKPPKPLPDGVDLRGRD